MGEGRPSVTAQRVAAYRLGFDRLTVGSGDPSADERLAADVAGPQTFDPAERMIRYLRARTSFFDRVVLHAIERGVTQLLVIGAGYDGRSLRYARAGVRWFEVDHPDTQSDKLARLDRLGIDTGRITFVCAERRAVATPGTRLALSASVSPPAGDQGALERFAASVAAAGEPARNTLTAEGAGRSSTVLAGGPSRCRTARSASDSSSPCRSGVPRCRPPRRP
jgi:Leucine carboxyl methyltransferase